MTGYPHILYINACLMFDQLYVDFSIAIGIFLKRELGNFRTLCPKVLLADEVDLYRLKKVDKR